MSRSRIRALSTTLALAGVLSFGIGAQVNAQSSPASLDAYIFQGSCSELSAEPLHRLSRVTPDDPRVAGSFRGSSSALGVLSSESEVRVSLSTLLGSTHSIVIGDSAAPSACGEIGGITRGVVSNDEIRVGLAPVSDSGIFGIAEIEGDGSETDIDLYIAAPFQ